VLEALGGSLSAAVGIAISPVPIIATVLMLLAPRARAASIGFAAGWLVGIVVAVGVTGALAKGLDGGPLLGSTARVVIYAVLGLLLLALAWREFRSRGEGGMPGWMSAVDSMSAGKAAALGAALAALNPKNLGLAAVAGVDIGGAGLSTAETCVVVLVFALLAGSTVLVPVIAYVLVPGRMAGPLASLKDWLIANNHTVMAVLLLVLGVAVLGKALAYAG
jgi:hypothetical protein